jgi:5'-phosphate synthase pdxT subunit
VDSFEARLPAPALGGAIRVAFIRAPRFRSLGPGVEVLARRDDEPVLVRQGRVLAATFHTELAPPSPLHRYAIGLAAGARPDEDLVRSAS